MQNAGGASSSTDNRMRISVASDRAQVVSKGVNTPAATSVIRSATTLAMTTPRRGKRAPTVTLPIPLKRRMVKSTTLSP